MEDTDFVNPGEVPQIVLERKSAELVKMKKEMASVRQAVDALIKDMQNSTQKERIKYNMEKALSVNADITHKETEDGKIVITVIKDGKSTEAIFDSLDNEVIEGIDKAMSLRRKKKSKDEAKNNVKVRYKIGDHLVLRGKIRDGSKRYIKKFEVKKVIWSIKGKPMNILILKQYEGNNNNTTLDRNDCKKYHIKYEEGLQAYSMMLNFSKIRKNNTEI